MARSAGGDEPDPLADVDDRLAAGDIDGVRAAIRALPERHRRDLEQEVGALLVDRFARGAETPKAGRVFVLHGIMGSLLAAEAPVPTSTGSGSARCGCSAVGSPASAIRRDDPIRARRAAPHLPAAADRAGRRVGGRAVRLRLATRSRRRPPPSSPSGSTDRRTSWRTRWAGWSAGCCGPATARSWDRLADGEPTAGGRLVMLGTPSLGSLSIATALTAEDKLVRWLARVDVRHSNTDIQQVIASFPGVYQLLPCGDAGTSPLLDASSWRDGQINGASLVQARRVAELLAADGFDEDRMLYVAGTGHTTAAELRVDGPGRFRFRVTHLGDGRVTHDSGLGRDADRPPGAHQGLVLDSGSRRVGQGPDRGRRGVGTAPPRRHREAADHATGEDEDHRAGRHVRRPASSSSRLRSSTASCSPARREASG